MKIVKRLSGVLLAVFMVIAMAIPAFAVDGNNTSLQSSTGNTITIENAQAGETYEIYKMLDLVVNADKDSFSYTVNIAWENFFGKGVGADYVKIDQKGYVSWSDKATSDDMIAFGKAAVQYVEGDGLTPVATKAPGSDGDITFDNLDPGYYLITSTNGTKVIVDTTPTDPNPSIKEKNENPTIDKMVEEDSTSQYGKVNDAEIGQTVNFKIVVSAKSGAKNYVVHDKMYDGLTFDGEKSVTVTANKGNISTSDYKVVGEGLNDSCDFHVVFKQDYLDTITDDTAITIAYSATLNEDAVIAGVGNPNDTKLTWGDNNETAQVRTITYTWEMGVLKYGNGDEDKVLAGAEFVLLSPDKTKVATFASGKITGWVDVPSADADGKIGWSGEMIQTTGSNGKINIEGLDSADTYRLREVKAPDGYNLLTDDTDVAVAASSDETTKTMTQTKLTAMVNNLAGAELPSAGGIGTTIFYVLGSILLIGAVVLLVTKKRMKATK